MDFSFWKFVIGGVFFSIVIMSIILTCWSCCFLEKQKKNCNDKNLEFAHPLCAYCPYVFLLMAFTSLGLAFVFMVRLTTVGFFVFIGLTFFWFYIVPIIFFIIIHFGTIGNYDFIGITGAVQHLKSVRSKTPYIDFHIECYDYNGEDYTYSLNRHLYLPCSHWCDLTNPLNLSTSGCSGIHVMTQFKFFVSPTTASIINNAKLYLYKQYLHRDKYCTVIANICTGDTVSDHVVLHSKDSKELDIPFPERPWFCGSFLYLLLSFLGFGVAMMTYAASVIPTKRLMVTKKVLLEDVTDPHQAFKDPIIYESVKLSEDKRGNDLGIVVSDARTRDALEMLKEVIPPQTDPFEANEDPLIAMSVTESCALSQNVPQSYQYASFNSTASFV